MQRLWLFDIDWDQSLPEESRTAWESYYASLSRINELRIPRNVVPGNSSDKFDIFGFGDASETAFGACLYAVSRDDEGNIHSHLICSKTKVAPLKTISMPRLELEAALLLAKLYTTVKTAYGERLKDVKLWSDSTIVLGWLKTSPNAMKTFVANRISKIQTLTKATDWYHVPSEDNPADMLSRGITVERLIEDKLWWHGPPWLTQEEPWPKNMRKPDTELPELKPVTVTLTTITVSSILEKFKSYRKLMRVIAYCLRWRNRKNPSKNRALTVQELDRAEKAIARMVQHERFAQEIRDLENKNEIHRKSPLRALTPVLDDEGLLRVGGRLRNAELSEDQKHQIILPAKHFVTTLILKEEHLRLHHCPPMQILHSVRHKFWPLSGHRETKKIVKACLPCFRFRPSFPEVKMGDLPAQRVCGFVRPFVTTGIDYAGPIQIRESRRRGRIHVCKGYIAVFTCFSTKAVHLELVTELTTEAFLAALRRFTARRGVCSQLFSDNATNFVGAARELKEIYEFLEKEKTEIENNLANQRIQWNFIPPRAPTFGGLWEAAVKVAKKHLYTMTRGLTLTYEEYSTLLTEIEAILNSRPLTPLSSDPADLSVLTPAHFLVGDSLFQPVQHDLRETPDNHLSRWEHLQKIRQKLWRRWQDEYLQELQKRSKWSKNGANIEVNTVVLLKDDNVSPLHWALGRIVELFPGPDGVVRVGGGMFILGLGYVRVGSPVNEEIEAPLGD
ncbi:uncharacterized protein [Venturia canescens]|uniref:uncharacterized protein n=1 Tax=Venturia canescens TaxID=32260 RepID=UPI001C9BDFE2|nr:uncharacterized protein LOC122408492 [Venturia canescens]